MESKNKAWLVLASFVMAFLAGGGVEGARDVAMKDGAYHPQIFWGGWPFGLGGPGLPSWLLPWLLGGLPFGLGGLCCDGGWGLWGGNKAGPGAKDKGNGHAGHEYGPPGRGGAGSQVP